LAALVERSAKQNSLHLCLSSENHARLRVPLSTSSILRNQRIAIRGFLFPLEKPAPTIVTGLAIRGSTMDQTETGQRLESPAAAPQLRTSQIAPRLLRVRDAPAYVGVDRNKFNADFRPYLTEIPLGRQALAFDRIELDALIDDYISRNGRRPKASVLEDDICQNATTCRGSASRAGSGRSKTL
jgi:hypothetical protein